MGSQIDIEDVEKLKKLWSFLSTAKEEIQVNKIMSVFPFGQLQDVTNKENMGWILKFLMKFLDTDQFLYNESDINHCVEFVLKNLKCFMEDSILEDFLAYLSQLLSRLRYVLINLNVNIDPERICCIIYDLSTNKDCREQNIRILIELFSCDGVRFQENEIYNTCVDVFYKNWMNFDFLDLCKLGSAVIRSSTRVNYNLISSTNTFYYWIERLCPSVLLSLSDELSVYEFLKCLSAVYSTKETNNFCLTDAYVNNINVFETYLKTQTLQDSVILIFRHILYDLSAKNVLPAVEDFNNSVLDSPTQVLTNKDFVIVTTYLKAIFTQHTIDENELFKCIARVCFSSDSFYPVTLKAMCFLYPKYVKHREKSNSIGNMILGALANCVHFEKVLSLDVDQLKWILNSEKIALKYITTRWWLKVFKDDIKLLAVLRETDNLNILVHFLLMDNQADDTSKRAANLVRLADDEKISKFLIKKIPIAIRNPVSLAHLLHAKPAIAKNPKEATFFCKVMATVIPHLLNTEAFVGACNYSLKLMFHMRNCSEAIRYFSDSYRTVSTLQNACLNKNEDVSIAGVELLRCLLKLQSRLDIEVKIPVELDFRRILTGSGNRIQKGLRLLQDILTTDLPHCLIKLLEDDILGQYLFLQDIEVEEMMAKILSIMTLFLKKYEYLAYSCSTDVFINMQLPTVQENGLVEEFTDFLEIFLKSHGNKLIRRYYSTKNLRKHLLKHRVELIPYL